MNLDPEDEKKNLWISTSKGLVCLNITTDKIKIYTNITGTLNDQFNFSSASDVSKNARRAYITTTTALAKCFT